MFQLMTTRHTVSGGTLKLLSGCCCAWRLFAPYYRTAIERLRCRWCITSAPLHFYSILIRQGSPFRVNLGCLCDPTDRSGSGSGAEPTVRPCKATPCFTKKHSEGGEAHALRDLLLYICGVLIGLRPGLVARYLHDMRGRPSSCVRAVRGASSTLSLCGRSPKRLHARMPNMRAQ